MLDFLFGINPLWWLAFAFVLGAIEMLTPSNLLIWPALSSLVVAGVLFLYPYLGGEEQLGLFAILSLVLTFVGRWLIAKYDYRRPDKLNLNEPAARMVGRNAVVVSFENQEGIVVIDGVRWHARCEIGFKAEPGDTVSVSAADGTTLIIS